MSFFEDAFISVKDFGSAVSRKTGQMVDVTKLKMSAAEISNEISNRYKALGKAIYDAQKSGVSIEGIIAECVSSIDALNERLDAVNSRIAGLQNKISCKSCGATLDPKAVFCSRCGARISRQEKSASQAAQDETPVPETENVAVQPEIPDEE